MEPEISLPYSQVPATRPYPEPAPSLPHDPRQLPADPSYNFPPISVWVSPMGWPVCTQLKIMTCMHALSNISQVIETSNNLRWCLMKPLQSEPRSRGTNLWTCIRSFSRSLDTSHQLYSNVNFDVLGRTDLGTNSTNIIGAPKS
jgi:hypothetical protein